ncbi:hypothetical protein AAIR98_001808 [Elusimicrobium simillimum]|uniref:CoA-binding protein n=1 Tax=Elusimicrobium simillimum TaxID=3143438 RepID=UPI003C70611B
MVDLKGKHVTVVGVSEDPTKYGNKIFKTLRQDGLDVYAVGKRGGQVAGAEVYKTLSEVPGKVDFVIMVVPPPAAVPVVEEAIKLGVKEMWFQPGAENPEAEKLANDNGIKTTSRACVMVQGGFW